MFFLKETKRFNIYSSNKFYEQVVLQDIFKVELSKNKKAFLCTTLRTPLTSESNPTHTFFETNEKHIYDLKNNFFDFSKGFIHARNFLQDNFSNKNNLDLIVFDHGLDLFPFPGAQNKFFRLNNNKYEIDENFFKFNQKSFVFGGFSGDWDGDGFPELFVCDLSGRGPFLFKNNQGISMSAADERLPITFSDWRFLSGTKFYDFEKKMHLALGGLGNDFKAESDIYFKNPGDGDFSKSMLEHFPKKRGGDDWATVEMKNIFDSKKPQSDILSLSHSADVQDGMIDIYLQNEEGQFDYFYPDRPVYFEKDAWIPRVFFCNLGGEGNEDLVAVKSRGLKNYVQKKCNVILLKKENNDYIDISSELACIAEKEFLGVVVLQKEKGISDLLFFETNGGYFYCEGK